MQSELKRLTEIEKKRPLTEKESDLRNQLRAKIHGMGEEAVVTTNLVTTI